MLSVESWNLLSQPAVLRHIFVHRYSHVPVGRFLPCRDCQLGFTFPDGVKFGHIAKQFELHSCVSPIHIPGRRSDRYFVIVRLEGKVPVMASCAKCERKLLSPTTLSSDAVGATEYLRQKFDVHHCPAEIEERETGRGL